ncbi:MAG: hypothetical protein ACOC57_03805, partial [Acidobacteriota bacterium]
LTLEKKSPCRFSFWLKTSKKKLSVVQITYDAKTDQFQKTGEEIFTFAVPNKIIHLEEETLDKLFSCYEKRDHRDLRELLILIYKNFSLEEEHTLHYLRAFHLVDILKQTSQEDVERTLIASPEFTESEKNKGVFIYKEKIKTEEEFAQEIREEEEAPSRPPTLSETIKEQILQEERKAAEAETVPPEEEPEIEEIEGEETQAELMEKEMPLEAEIKEEEEEKTILQEKEAKKKKIKEKIAEPEKAPRRRKGDKKHIEERIEMEESEQEALFAIKTEEEAEEEASVKKEKEKEEKEEFKPPVSPPPSFGGIFAEKLKSALEEKKKEKKKK